VVIAILMASGTGSAMVFFQVGQSDRTDVFQESVRGVQILSFKNLKVTHSLLQSTKIEAISHRNSSKVATLQSTL
jgi:hypothetical protein